MADQHRMPPHHPRIIGTRHMVALANDLAAQAGFEILEAGGNALGVLQCEYVHFAAVAPIMSHLAETNATVTISGLGPWPKLASAARFRDHQRGRILANIKRCVVPAAPDSWITALERYGIISFAQVAAAAIRCGREGIGMPSISAEAVDTIKRWPQNAAIYLPAERRAAERRPALLPDRPGELHPVHGGRGNRRHAQGWPSRRPGRRARRVLARRHRAQDRRLPQGQRRLVARGRPVRVPRRYRNAAVGAVRRPDRVRLPPVVPRPGAAANPENPRWHRAETTWPQHPSLHPHADRGLETCLRRSRRVLRRPEIRRRADRRAAQRRLRRAPPRADQPRQRMAGNAAGRHRRRAGTATRRRGARRGARARRARSRHLVCLRDRPARQLLLRHAQRRLDQRPDHSGHGTGTVLARHAVLDRPDAPGLPRARQAPAPDAQPGDRAARRALDHAVRHARQRRSSRRRCCRCC